MSVGKITVHVEEKHICGHTYEVIYHLEEGEVTARVQCQEEATKKTLELTGRYGVVEVNGIEWKEGRVICRKCGVDMIYGLVAQNTSETGAEGHFYKNLSANLWEKYE